MKLLTEKQKNLIEDMNEFCHKKFIYNDNTTSKEASEYISANIDEFKLEMEAMNIGSCWYSRYN